MIRRVAWWAAVLIGWKWHAAVVPDDIRLQVFLPTIFLMGLAFFSDELQGYK